MSINNTYLLRLHMYGHSYIENWMHICIYTFFFADEASDDWAILCLVLVELREARTKTETTGTGGEHTTTQRVNQILGNLRNDTETN